MLLGLAALASGIDDFESYYGPDIETVWMDADGGGPSTSQAILLTSGAAQGAQAMEWDYHVAGGWSNPDDPANYDNIDNAMIGRAIDPLDWQAGGELHLMVRPYDADLGLTNWYLLQYHGDQGIGQSWIPTAKWIDSTGMWWQPHEIPAIIAPTGWVYTSQPWYAYFYDTTPVIYAGNWGEVVIKDNMGVPWFQNDLTLWDAMTQLNIGVWTGWNDTTGASGNYKIGTDGATIWPLGPITGRMDVDNIYYVLPEPATVALLGLGGLALIRRKK